MISSFGSAWPRTSSSLTPQSASPGSYALICPMPIAISGPKRITKLITKSSSSWTTIWTPCVGFENSDESDSSSVEPGWKPNQPPTESNTQTAHCSQT